MAALGVVALSLHSDPASALLGDTQGAFGIDGTFRTTLFGLRNYDNPRLFGAGNGYDVLSQSSLRVIVAGRPRDWLAFQLHAVQDLVTTTIPSVSGQPSPLQPAVRRFLFLRNDWDWVQENDTVASLSPDRYSVKLIAQHADLTVGRQTITLGKAYLWNPLDIFGPFDPQQFDRDYKPSIDAARLSLATGETSGMEIVGAFGREIATPTSYKTGGRVGCDWYGSAVIGRLYAAAAGFDLSLQGGKTYGGSMLGIGAVREVGLGIQVRGEAAYTWETEHRTLLTPLPDRVVEDSLQAVVSAGHKWQNSFDLEAEYYFNGAGESRDNLAAGRLRQISGGTQQWGRNYIGTTVSYDFLSILTGRVVGILSLTDDSGLIEPFLTWSMAEDWDLLFGAIINLGDRPTTPSDPTVPVLPRSEFGTYPSSLFLQIKTFF